MTAKKQEVVSIVPYRSQLPAPIQSFPEQLPITRLQRRSAIEARYQQQVMEQQRVLTIIAARATGAITTAKVTVFNTTAEEIYAQCSGAKREPKLQELIDKYAEESAQRLGAQLREVTDVGVFGIASVLARSTYMERDGKEPGFFARMFGSDESL